MQIFNTYNLKLSIKYMLLQLSRVCREWKFERMNKSSRFITEGKVGSLLARSNLVCLRVILTFLFSEGWILEQPS